MKSRISFLSEIVRLVLWGRVKTVIYEASDTINVSLTHEKYRYDTAVNRRYKTIFFWCYNTHGMPQFWNALFGALKHAFHIAGIPMLKN